MPEDRLRTVLDRYGDYRYLNAVEIDGGLTLKDRADPTKIAVMSLTGLTPGTTTIDLSNYHERPVNIKETLIMADQTPPPTPPTSAVVTVDLSGVKTNYDLSPEAIVVLNTFMHYQGHTGTFGERLIQLVTNTVKQLASRPEFAPSVKIEADAYAVKIAKLADDISKPKGAAK